MQRLIDRTGVVDAIVKHHVIEKTGMEPLVQKAWGQSLPALISAYYRYVRQQLPNAIENEQQFCRSVATCLREKWAKLNKVFPAVKRISASVGRIRSTDWQRPPAQFRKEIAGEAGRAYNITAAMLLFHALRGGE